MSFAALTSATAGYLEIFFHDTDATAKHYVDGFVLFALIPFLIILINSRGVFVSNHTMHEDTSVVDISLDLWYHRGGWRNSQDTVHHNCHHCILRNHKKKR